MKAFVKTLFHTSSLSYAVFLAADYLRPGFVSYVFSVHWFALVAILSGLFYAASYHPGRSEEVPRFFSKIWLFAWQFVFAILLAVIVWDQMEAVGDLRIFITLVGFLLPWLVIHLLTYER